MAPLRVTFVDPHLPEWLPEVSLRGVRVGGGELDIHAWRDASGRSRYRVTKRGFRMAVLRQPPPQDPAGGLGRRLLGLLPG
jgi:hypothetical protein